MSPDVPGSSKGRARPDATVRRRSLGLGAGSPAGTRPPAREGVSNRARSFRELLDTIPDLDDADARPAPAPAAEPPAGAEATPPPAAAKPTSPGSEVRVIGPVETREPRPVEIPEPRRDGRARPPWWRRLGFALATVVLVAAIPVLGREGYRLVVRSTDGREVDQTSDPLAPNYEEIVDSTPTMVLVQSGPDGTLGALTFVSLNSERGGTVMFVPNMAGLRAPAYGLGALEMVYNTYWPKVDRAQQSVAHEVAALLNVGIDVVVPVDDRSLAQLTGPVGSIAVDNPDEVTLPDGTVLPVGNVVLTPEQVGPYLGYRAEGEDQLSQFVRHERVWRSWLAAVAESNDPAIVPGLTDRGVGRFVRALSAGSVNYTVLPGLYDEAGLFVTDDTAMGEALLAAVPVPDPPVPGARTLVRLLNGVEPGSVSNDIIRTVVAADASVAILGNGPSFDRDTTEIVYREESSADAARTMLAALGATGGTVRLEPSAPDNVDLTVIVGRDAVAAAGGGT